MNHQNGRKKLNLPSSHRRALLRNQAITLIEHGSLTSTKARVREVQRMVEKLVTLARNDGNTMNARRRAKQIIPYRDATLRKLFVEIAPRYVGRPGGYTRVIPMGRRVSDTATIARLEWVQEEVQ
jgi:large subunit ribosomal protein L17